MHLQSVVVALCLSLTASAQAAMPAGMDMSPMAGMPMMPGMTEAEIKKEKAMKGDKKKCAEIRRLTAFTKLMSNATRLDAFETKHKLTDDQRAELKAKGANATAMLQKLESNSTLATECAMVNADRKMKQECKAMKGLTKFTKFVNNATALDMFAKKKNLTEAQVQKIKDRGMNATKFLNKLESNKTLVDDCMKMMKSKGGKNGTNGGKAATSSAVSMQTSFSLLSNGAFALFLGSLGAMLML
ncbi:hypothetical protein BT63DRAFT_428081 [Microthyrium microscopicum]|uniref:Uncharacterized protein n=1 Tax=Microthyrium microscopicum TaxID=703497 RepID=A0A6A6U4E8_9PEZI|nr:hypothetical protein BT63DRAFT_428081 [Microthyrium microscopicum]